MVSEAHSEIWYRFPYFSASVNGRGRLKDAAASGPRAWRVDWCKGLRSGYSPAGGTMRLPRQRPGELSNTCITW